MHRLERAVRDHFEDALIPAQIAHVLDGVSEEPYAVIPITHEDIEAVTGRVAAEGLEPPPRVVVECIAVGTEVLLRRRLRRELHPKATVLEFGGTPTGEVVVPLHGDADDHMARIQKLAALFTGGVSVPEPAPAAEPTEDGVAAAAAITEACLEIARAHEITPEQVRPMLKTAIAEARRTDAPITLAMYECGHVVVAYGEAPLTCIHPGTDPSAILPTDPETQYCGSGLFDAYPPMVSGWDEYQTSVTVRLGDPNDPAAAPWQAAAEQEATWGTVKPEGFEPHEFEGRLDQGCDICQMPDRNPIHRTEDTSGGDV